MRFFGLVASVLACLPVHGNVGATADRPSVALYSSIIVTNAWVPVYSSDLKVLFNPPNNDLHTNPCLHTLVHCIRLETFLVDRKLR
jgi:hypothetical protein